MRAAVRVGQLAGEVAQRRLRRRRDQPAAASRRSRPPGRARARRRPARAASSKPRERARRPRRRRGAPSASGTSSSRPGARSAPRRTSRSRLSRLASPGQRSANSSSSASISRERRVDRRRRSKSSLLEKAVRPLSMTMSLYWPPKALSAPAVRGTSTRSAAELARDRDDVQPGGAAAGDERALARVDALVDRDLLDRGDHELVGERQDRGRRGVAVDAQLRRQIASITRPRGIDVERHRAAEEALRVEVAEHDRGVGDGRLGAAAAVAGGAGVGAGALGADAQQPAGVEPGDRAAAGPDRCARRPRRGRSGGRRTAAPSQVSRVEHDAAVADHADVEARAAGVADDHVAAGRARARCRGGRPRGRARARTERRWIGRSTPVHRQHAAERGGREQLARRTRRRAGPPRSRAGAPASAASARRRSRSPDVRRYSRMIGLSRCESVYGTPGSSSSSSSPRRSSCSGLAIDQSRETATASTPAGSSGGRPRRGGRRRAAPRSRPRRRSAPGSRRSGAAARRARGTAARKS